MGPPGRQPAPRAGTQPRSREHPLVGACIGDICVEIGGPGQIPAEGSPYSFDFCLSYAIKQV